MITATASLLGSLIGGNVGERIFEQSPPRAVRIVGAAIAGFSVLLAFAVFLPTVWVFVPAAWVGLLALQIGIAPLYTALSAISPPRLRPLMFSLLGLMVAVMGGIAGGVIVGLITEATDIRWGLARSPPPASSAACSWRVVRRRSTPTSPRSPRSRKGDPLAAFL